MTSVSNVAASLLSMALCTAVEEAAAVGEPRERIVARLPGEAVEQLLAVGDVGHRAHHGGVVGPSESPSGRELTDSHWSLPCSSRTPMTTLVVASRRARATASGRASGGNGEPSSRTARRPR